jgi:uncharacterized protein YqjF (DUF2071 family)
MTQAWRDLLFAHWPVAPGDLLPTLPPGLRLDTYAGQAWVSVTPFLLTGLRLRGLPPLPGCTAFPELNVRTYVTGPSGARPGIFFYSLDAASPLAVAGARLLGLPYFVARMTVRRASDWVDYRAERAHPGAPPARFVARYRPTGPAAPAALGSLPEWLVERYCLYAVAPAGVLHRLEIHHGPWLLQPAEAALDPGTLVSQHGITLPPGPPLLHFARRQEMRGWPPDPLASS